MTFLSPPYLDSFLEMLSAERGLSKNTCQAYATDLTEYFRFSTNTSFHSTDNAQDLSSLNEKDLLRYLTHLEKNQISVATRARRLSALKHYVKFLQQENYLDHNFTVTFQGPRQGKRLPKILHEEEVDALLETVMLLQSPEGLRLRCLLEVLYATGMRVTELLTLTIATIFQAFRTQQKYLVIQGKGKKERIVPLTDTALEALKEYLNIRQNFEPHFKGKPKTTSWLFPSHGAQGHLTRQGFAKLLKGLALEAGLAPQRVSPHVIRHAFATHLLNRGADLLSLQKLLGHKDVSTTEIYTHVLTEKMEDLVLNHHPLSKTLKLGTTES